MSTPSWANYAGLAAPLCVVCCSSVCYLDMPSLLIDGTVTPYADLAAAGAAIDDMGVGCVVQYEPAPTPARTGYDFLSTDNSEIRFDVYYTPAATVTDRFITKFHTSAGDVAVQWGLSDGGATSYSVTITAYLYAEDQTTLIDSDSHSSSASANTVSSSLNLTVPDGSNYVLLVEYTISWGGTPTGTTAGFTIVSAFGPTIDACVLRANYDDGVGVSQLVCAV